MNDMITTNRRISMKSISKFRLTDRLKVTLPFPAEIPYQGKTMIIRKNPSSNPFDPKGYSQRFASIA